MTDAEQRILLFDVDGVLIHGYHARPELRQCWDENLLHDFGIDRERFKNEFIFDTFIKNVITGKKSLHEELALCLPKLGANCEPQTFIDYWLKNDGKINHALIGKIKKLKASGKVRLFVATNQEHNRARYLMKELGFADLFEDIFYSARIGSAKPDKEYFDYIERELALPHNQKPIFFDDTPSVVKAAQAYGWEAIEFIDETDLNRSPFVMSLLDA